MKLWISCCSTSIEAKYPLTFDKRLHKLFRSDELESFQLDVGELLSDDFGVFADLEEMRCHVHGRHRRPRWDVVDAA